jgi:hypothetical protein
MMFMVVMIISAIVPGIVGALSAYRYSVYVLVPVSLFFLVLAIAGCVVYNSSLSASTLAVVSGLTCLHFGYFLSLFVSQAGRARSATPSGLKRAQLDARRRRPFDGQPRNVEPSVPNSLKS